MTRFPIPLDRGLDRSTGQLVVDSSSAVEIRDFLPREGKLEARPGMGVSIGVAALGDAVCHQDHFRAKSLLIEITYDRATRAVTVYALDLNGVPVATIGTLGTLATGALEPPRFFTAESYSFLVIAHDEPNVTKRIKTQYTDGASLTSLVANLDTLGSNDTVFRGTEQWLGYTWQWGYGANNDKNRPEVLRPSRPSDPRTLDATVAFLGGPRDEPILRAIACDAGLLLCKERSTYLLSGQDYATFGVKPRDGSYGLAAGRLAVKVGGTVYGWTHVGPRSTSTGIWDALELPLALKAALATDYPQGLQVELGHASYWSDEDTVLFAFPDLTANQTLVVALSLRGTALRWSHWVLPVAILSACFVGVSNEAGAVSPGLSSATSHGGVQTGAIFQTKVTVTHSAAVGDETIEVWGKQGANPYLKLTSFPIVTAAATQSKQIVVGASGSWDLAVRYLRNGIPRSDHTGDPSTWPAGAKATGTVTALPAIAASGLTYVPGATIAAGTWNLSWAAPVTGATVQVQIAVRSIEPVDTTFGNTSYVDVIGTLFAPFTVYNSPPNATSISGLSTTQFGQQMAGREVLAQVIQSLTVNGVSGFSLPSGLIQQSGAGIWGIHEIPGMAAIPYDVQSFKVGTPPGTFVKANWVNTASVASASSGVTEVVKQYKVPSSNLSQSIRSAIGTSLTSEVFPAVAPCDCGTAGQGNNVLAWTYVRHRLVIAGVEQFTIWRSIGQVGGICSL